MLFVALRADHHLTILTTAGGSWCQDNLTRRTVFNKGAANIGRRHKDRPTPGSVFIDNLSASLSTQAAEVHVQENPLLKLVPLFKRDRRVEVLNKGDP